MFWYLFYFQVPLRLRVNSHSVERGLGFHGSCSSLPREARVQAVPRVNGSPVHTYKSVEITNVWTRRCCSICCITAAYWWSTLWTAGTGRWSSLSDRKMNFFRFPLSLTNTGALQLGGHNVVNVTKKKIILMMFVIKLKYIFLFHVIKKTKQYYRQDGYKFYLKKNQSFFAALRKLAVLFLM